MFEPAAFGLMADDPEVRPFIDSIQAVLTTDPSPDEVLRRSVALVGDDLSRFSIPLPESLVGAARVQMRSVFCWRSISRTVVRSGQRSPCGMSHSGLSRLCTVVPQVGPLAGSREPKAQHAMRLWGGAGL